MHHSLISMMSLGTFCSAMIACATGPSEVYPGTLPSRERLRSTFGTDELNSCDANFQPDWSFPGAQRNLRLLRIQAKNVLVYDLITRQATRTIWQPLAKDYSFEGDGRAIGKVDKGALTLDFEMREGARDSLWIGYRFKYPSKTFAAAQIEWLPSESVGYSESRTSTPSAPHRSPKKLVTIPLKSGPYDSVQKLWVLPGNEDRPWEANVVTLTYRFKPDTLGSDWQENDAATLFSWYRVDGRTGLAQLQGSYVDDLRSIETATFVQLDGVSPPFAVTVEHGPTDVPKKSKRLSRINLRQLFVKDATSSELFSASDTVLANLDALVVSNATSCQVNTLKPSSQEGCQIAIPHKKISDKKSNPVLEPSVAPPSKRLTIAWTRASEDEPGVMVQWLDLALPETQDAPSNQLGLLHSSVLSKPSRRQGYAKTSYPPVALKLHNLAETTQGTSSSVYLTWTATTPSETAFLALPIGNTLLPIDTQTRSEPETEKIDPRAYIVQKEALVYLGTAVQSGPNAVALVLFSELPPNQTASNGPRFAHLDPVRLPVQICSVRLRSQDETATKGTPVSQGSTP